MVVPGFVGAGTEDVTANVDEVEIGLLTATDELELGRPTDDATWVDEATAEELVVCTEDAA